MILRIIHIKVELGDELNDLVESIKIKWIISTYCSKKKRE